LTLNHDYTNLKYRTFMSKLMRFIPLFLIFFITLISFSLVTSSQHNADAQTNCNSDPSWILDEAEGSANSVTYHLFLKNNCAAAKDFNLRVTQLPTEPRNINGWTWKFANGQQNTTYTKRVAGGKRAAVALTVSRPTNVNAPEGNYSPITLRAALSSNTGINDEINLMYRIESPKNPPTPDPTCKRNTPLLDIDPSEANGAPGDEKEFQVKISNKDTDGCKDSTFDISTTIDAPNWDLVAGRNTLTISPGADKSTTLYATPPMNQADGPVTITVNIVRNVGGVVSQNVLYAVGKSESEPEPSISEEPEISPNISETPNPGTISLTLGLDGIGNSRILGGNKNPVKDIKNLSVYLYNAESNELIESLDEWSFKYNPTTGKFNATMPLTGGLKDGLYNVYIEGPQYLMGKFPGTSRITPGQDNTISGNLHLTVGDINKLDRSRNEIDLNDYNILISCSIYSQDRTLCDLNSKYEEYSDLNSDGIVDHDDINIWLTEIKNRRVAELPNN